MVPTGVRHMSTREDLANAHRDEMFKFNPDGFTVAPYVNSETLADSFEQGWESALKNAPEVKELVEALELFITGTPDTGLENYMIERAKSALSAFDARGKL